MSDTGAAAPPRPGAPSAALPAPRSPLASARVSGGPRSVSARLEALDEAAAVLTRVAGVLDELGGEVLAAAGALPSQQPMTAVLARVGPGGAPPQLALAACPVAAEVTAAIGHGRSGLGGCSAELSAAARHLRAVALLYRAEDGELARDFAAAVAGGVLDSPLARVPQAGATALLDLALPGLLGLVASRGDSGRLQSGSQSPSGLVAHLFASPAFEPLVGGLAVGLMGTEGGEAGAVRRLDAQLSRTARRDGLFGSDHAVVAPAPADPAAVPAGPPRGAGDLLRRLSALGPDASPAAVPARILVQRTLRPDGSRVATVYIPGTQAWTTGGANPFDLQSDGEEAAGQRSAASAAVTRALNRAGVTRDEPLLLVGHSQGGMTAVALAGDPAFRRRFHPTAVVTAGSPVAADAVPHDVRVLALEHADDGVPHLDGAPEPPSARTTTITTPTPVVHDPVSGRRLGPHDTGAYVVTGDAVDASRDPRVVAGRRALAPFLGGEGTSTSTLWRVHRVDAPAVAPVR